MKKSEGEQNSNVSSDEFIESEKSFRNRRDFPIYFMIGFEIFFLIIMLMLYIFGTESPEGCLGLVLFAFVNSLLIILIIVSYYLTRKMKRFEIRDLEFLDPGRNKWVDFSKINKIYYRIVVFRGGIIIIYDNSAKEARITSLIPEDVLKIKRIFEKYHLKVTKPPLF
ncbi:hypothetical protein [[Eubacterium] cellulosolvens]